MSRVYLDACTIIYLIEGAQPFQAQARGRIAQLRSVTATILMTSRLSRLECRTAPLRAANASLLAEYDTFFKPSDLQIIEIGALVIERATELRARHRFKTPDAIHLATAVEEHADLFITGDDELRRCTEIAVEILPG